MAKKHSPKNDRPSLPSTGSGEKESMLEELKPADWTRIQAYRERAKEYDRRRPPKLRAGKDAGKLEIEGDQVMHAVATLEATGTVDMDLANRLTAQVVNAAPAWLLSKPENHNAALAMLNGIRPKNELEGMIGVQMVASHNLAMEFLRRAVGKDQTSEGTDLNLNRATKLLRSFTTQLEALNRLRGRGQQRITVEHVTVHDGGQAIVGNIAPRGAQSEKT